MNKEISIIKTLFSVFFFFFVRALRYEDKNPVLSEEIFAPEISDNKNI